MTIFCYNPAVVGYRVRLLPR